MNKTKSNQDLRNEDSKPENLEKDDFRREMRDWRKHRERNPFWGIVFLSIGVIFLLNNFGILSWDVWDILWKFWPIFLIVVGLQIILGKSLIAKMIISLISILLVLFAVLFAVSQVNPNINEWVQRSLPWFPGAVKYIPQNY